MAFDQSSLLNNTGYGGGIYFQKSTIEIHNSQGVNNTAGFMGHFAVILESKFQSYYLHLYETLENSIAIKRSKGEMKETYLSDLRADCPIAVQIIVT